MVASLPSTSAPTYQAAAAELLEVANFMEAQRLHGVRSYYFPDGGPCRSRCRSLHARPLLTALPPPALRRSCSSATTQRTA
jgi:hypothetical protein